MHVANHHWMLRVHTAALVDGEHVFGVAAEHFDRPNQRVPVRRIHATGRALPGVVELDAVALAAADVPVADVPTPDALDVDAAGDVDQEDAAAAPVEVEIREVDVHRVVN